MRRKCQREYMREWRKNLTPEKRELFLVKERARSREYQKTDAGRTNLCSRAKEYRDKIRVEVIVAYGGACACCGEDQLPFLTIDHIVPLRSSKDRKSSYQLSAFLKKHGFPDGYQVLCFNCNLAKGIAGECPHRSLYMSRLNKLTLVAQAKGEATSTVFGITA